MIFVIGGSAQGKREFAERTFGAGRKVRWTDGAAASFEEMMEAEFADHVHCFCQRILRGEISMEEISAGAISEGEENAGQKPDHQKPASQITSSLETLAARMKEARPDRVVVGDETGCGIVPLDPELRRIREETGRMFCRMAKEADQVWRVTCGIGQRIK